MSDADRWTRVEALFAELSDAPESRRHAVLASVDDPEVSAEVDRLLRAHDQLTGGDSGFLKHLDARRAHELVDVETTTPPGMTIGRYPVVRPLGRGGMGIVYLARDPRLDRQVAIKLLPQYLSGDPTAVSRLAAEARTASALDDPHIATVYEIAETDDGQAFIVMAYYDGETLRERLTHGPLYLDEAMDVCIQLADGLSAAHRAGIIHRDIKPENVILTRDGVLKILDFGIAKVASADLATGGLMRGTAAYMSPEQSRGDPVDHRTDLWSAGVLLHELLTGTRPFSGEGEALIDSIRRDPPAPLAPTRSGIPPALATLIARCLEKAPSDRIATATELASQLRDIRDGHALPPPTRTRAAWWIAAALVLAAGASIVTRGGVYRSARMSAPPASPAIAVLPFDARGTDLDIWREGMVDLLSANFDDVAGLRAIDSRTILARWTGRTGSGGTPGLDDALAFARSTGARFAVLGSVVASPSGLRMAGRVYTLDDGALLASPQAEGSADSVFALIDRFSIAILTAAWEGRERPTARVDLARVTTQSLPALKSYLNAERHFRRADLSAAISAYEDAVAADSTFALAHYHLGIALGWLGNVAPDHSSRAARAFHAALRHSARLPARDELLLRAALDFYIGQPKDLWAARERLLLATRSYPDDAEAWYHLGEVSFHAGEQLLTPREEGLEAFRTAVQLDPGFALAYEHLIHYAIAEGRDSAYTTELLRRYQQFAPDSEFGQEHRLNFALAFGDSSTRHAALAEVTRAPWPTLTGVLVASRSHPEVWSGLRRALGERPQSSEGAARFVVSRLCDFNFAEGRVGATMLCLRDSLVFPAWAPATWYAMYRARARVPSPALDSALRFRPPDTSYSAGWVLQTFIAGAYAADRRDWDGHADRLRDMTSAAQRLLVSGDSAAAGFATGAAIALEGHGVRRKGDVQAAVRLMARGQRETAWLTSRTRTALNETIRWSLAETLLEAGRWREAVAYLESLRTDPWAARRLAETYEKLGEGAKARTAYEFVAQAWRDADPDIQPLAREARLGAARLARAS